MTNMVFFCLFFLTLCTQDPPGFPQRFTVPVCHLPIYHPFTHPIRSNQIKIAGNRSWSCLAKEHFRRTEVYQCCRCDDGELV